MVFKPGSALAAFASTSKPGSEKRLLGKDGQFEPKTSRGQNKFAIKGNVNRDIVMAAFQGKVASYSISEEFGLHVFTFSKPDNDPNFNLDVHFESAVKELVVNMDIAVGIVDADSKGDYTWVGSEQELGDVYKQQEYRQTYNAFVKDVDNFGLDSTLGVCKRFQLVFCQKHLLAVANRIPAEETNLRGIEKKLELLDL